MQERPLYWTSISLALGMAASHVWMRESGETVWWMSIILCLYAGYAIRSYRGKSCLFLLAAGVIGFVYYSFYDQSNQTALSATHDEQWIEGEMISNATIDGDRVKFLLQIKKVNGVPLEEKIDCYVPLKTKNELKEAQELRAGSYLRFHTRLISPQTARNPGTFDYQNYLYYKKIHWTARPSTFSSLMIDPPSRLHPRWILEQVQATLSETIDRTFPASAANIMKGLLIGIRQDLSPEMMNAYSKLGFTHVLAISGLHMTVLVAGLLAFMRGAGFSRETSILTTMGFIPAYVILVGAAPSVVRSGIMAVAVLYGHFLNRPRDGLNIWGAALIIMILCNPYQLWDIGFQLSFAVTWGLLTLSSPLQQAIPIPTEPFRSLHSVTLAAQLVSFPLTIYYFHQYHVLSFFVNLIFVPLYSFIITPLGFIGLLLGLIHPALALIPANIVSFLLYWINVTLEQAAIWKGLIFYLACPPTWWMVLNGFVLIRGTWLTSEKKKFWIIGMIFSYMLLPLHSYQGEKVTVTFLDVGQGDAIVIEGPDDRVYLIDGGGIPFQPDKKEAWKQRHDPYDPGKRIIIPFLKSRGIEEIDLLIMTHGDLDHIGGLTAVIRELNVKQVLWNGRTPSSEVEKALLALIKEQKISLQLGRRGLTWKDHPGVQWTVLHPSSDSSESDNNRSIVLLLDAFGKKVLFTGDLELKGERELLDKVSLGPIDVLKVGHHGSRTSTGPEWVDRLNPALAIISVGEQNRFGHPHPETLETLDKAGSRILRTDQSGAITLEFAKKKMGIETFLQPSEK